MLDILHVPSATLINWPCHIASSLALSERFFHLKSSLAMRDYIASYRIWGAYGGSDDVNVPA